MVPKYFKGTALCSITLMSSIHIVLFSEKYFDMNKKHCKEALDIYKKFLVRMDKVAEFLKVAEVSYVDMLTCEFCRLLMIFVNNLDPDQSGLTWIQAV